MSDDTSTHHVHGRAQERKHNGGIECSCPCALPLRLVLKRRAHIAERREHQAAQEGEE